MRPVAKLVLRFLVVVAVATAATVFYGPPSGSRTPYMSALSELTLGAPAQAKLCHSKCNPLYNICVEAHCGLKDCDVLCVFSGSTCSTQTCP